MKLRFPPKRMHIVVALLTVGVLAVTGCGSSATTTDKGATLRIGTPTDLGALDPAILTASGDKQLASNIFQGLVRFKLGSVDTEPALAVKWSYDKSGTKWTFQLRQNVQFQKGFGEMKSADVVFSLDRVLNPATASPNASFLSSIEDVTAQGDFKVMIQLKAPNPTLLAELASSYASIVSKAAVQEKGDKFSHDPVGTGPYEFKSWQPGQATNFKAFSGYWGGKPSLAGLTYRTIPDPNTLKNAFLAGEVDVVPVSNADTYAEYKAKKDVSIISAPGLSTRFLGMKSDEKPFNDPTVRKAVTMAINRDAMLQGLFKGISQPASGMLSPEVEDAKTDILNYKYDPEGARLLLKEAGYADGLNVRLTVPNVDRFTAPAAVIQRDLEKVGIHAKIVVMDAQSFLAALKSQNGLQMFLNSRSQDPQPDRILNAWFSSDHIPADNWARVSDPQVDKWLSEATSILDEARRSTLFAKIQDRVAEDNYNYYIDHENFIFAARSYVKGFVGDPQRMTRVDDVKIVK